ncbi:MAG: lysophospholipase [Clostridia bacterium]|nr:lysophospholipase [Clostridia bacterium]
MSIIKKEYSYPSSGGMADIYARVWLPEDKEIKAVIQLIHGKSEHGDRYEHMAQALCDAGYAFAINDHIGHGRSMKAPEDIGYFGADKNKGGKTFVEDARTFTLMLKKEFDKPLIIMGHSMGSFVVRKYVAEYTSGIEGVIICGTAGSNPALSAGLMLTNIIMKLKGDRHRSMLIEKIAFGTYNKRCQGRTEFDWLTRDDAVVDKYAADEKCGFVFTVSGFKNMFELLKDISGDEWYSKVPKNLPILLISGAEDPVGEYGKGVREVYEKLGASGHDNLEMKLYKDCRHEIHNEFDKEQVFADIIAWSDKLIK